MKTGLRILMCGLGVMLGSLSASAAAVSVPGVPDDGSGHTVVNSQTSPDGRKYVGLFYFVWLGQHGDSQNGIYDISKLQKSNPEDLFRVGNFPDTPSGKYHFWGEPLYGYYNSCDPWVVARHIELFMAAGIDYLMLDTTNSFVYPEPVKVLLSTLKKFKEQGFDVPKLAFYVNSNSGSSAKKLKDNYFQTDEWDGLFFSPNGKPLIVGVTKYNQGSTDQPLTNVIGDDLMEFFDVHESQWPNRPLSNDTFPWISWDYPQHIHNGTVSVSVSQHNVETICFSDTLKCQGRGWDAVEKVNHHEDVRSGRNFRNQWKTVFDNIDKVDNVFVTSWNEWVALKLTRGDKAIFVDLFNEEYSRDCEMPKGGYGDSFYLMLRDNIRRFKGSCGSLEPVDGVYRDVRGDAFNRDFMSFDRTFNYTDSSARNDIVSVRVSDDAKSVKFEITTAEPVSAYVNGDLGWMNILVRTVGNPVFEYDYVLNRYPTVNGSTTVERISADGKTVCGKAAYSVKGKVLTVVVPLDALGLQAGNVHFDFKVADNVTHPDDIMDYYVSGDSAPIGRLGYSY